MRRRGVADEFRTGRNVGLIAIASRYACATFDEDAKSVPHQRLDNRRYQRNTTLVCRTLNWYSNCEVRHFDFSSSSFVQLLRLVLGLFVSDRYSADIFYLATPTWLIPVEQALHGGKQQR